MRLEDHHQASARPQLAHGGDGTAQFGRVMAVVVHQRDAIAGDVAFGDLEASRNAPVLCQPAHDGVVVDAFDVRHRDGGQRVLHVVAARHRQGDLQVFAATEDGAKRRHAGFDAAHRLRPTVGLAGEAVGDDAWLDVPYQIGGQGIVAIDDRRAVERQLIGEIHERAAQTFDILTVGVHVVLVDVGDDPADGTHMQKRSVALVGFGDEVGAAPQLRIAAIGRDFAADGEAGGQSGGLENAGRHARHGGLAVGAGNGDALSIAHQFGQHRAAPQHRNAASRRGGHFNVGGGDGARRHHHVGGVNGASVVLVGNRCAQLGETLRRRRAHEIRTADGVALRQQQFGDAAHAGTADANHVDMLHGAHARNAGQPSARLRQRLVGRHIRHGQHSLGARFPRRSAVPAPRSPPADGHHVARNPPEAPRPPAPSRRSSCCRRS